MDWRDQSELQSGTRVLSRYAMCSWLDCRALRRLDNFESIGSDFDYLVAIEAFSENFRAVSIEALTGKSCVSALLDSVL